MQTWRTTQLNDSEGKTGDALWKEKKVKPSLGLGSRKRKAHKKIKHRSCLYLGLACCSPNNKIWCSWGTYDEMCFANINLYNDSNINLRS